MYIHTPYHLWIGLTPFPRGAEEDRATLISAQGHLCCKPPSL